MLLVDDVPKIGGQCKLAKAEHFSTSYNSPQFALWLRGCGKHVTASCFMECKIGIDIISPHAFGSESMLPLTRIHV